MIMVTIGIMGMTSTVVKSSGVARSRGREVATINKRTIKSKTCHGRVIIHRGVVGS